MHHTKNKFIVAQFIVPLTLKKKRHWLFFQKNRPIQKTPTNPYHNKQESNSQKIKKNNQKNNQPKFRGS